MNKNRIAMLGSLIFCVMMVTFPSVCVTGAQNALWLWANTALPALFPFFICANFMIAINIPQMIGKKVEPVIRGCFRVPGEVAFAFVMSITSGYPVGAKIIADLRKRSLLTRVEAERALSFCSTTGPLFMLGAVGVGMFSSLAIGWVIACSHYTGAIINGLMFGRLYGKEGSRSERTRSETCGIMSFNSSSTSVPHQKGIMELLTDAILEATKTLLIICGYMVLFLVLVEILKMAGVGDNGLLVGFFEMTAGCERIAFGNGFTLMVAGVICSSIVSWGGLSVQAQTLSVLSQTDIRIRVFLLSKISHMIWASLAAIPFSLLFLSETVATWTTNAELWSTRQNQFTYHFLFSSSLLIIVIVTFFILAILSPFFSEKEKKMRKKRRADRMIHKEKQQAKNAEKTKEKKRS